MKIDVKQAARILKKQKSVTILTHNLPDGDAIGAGFGLLHILRELGISGKVLCHDKFPEKFSYITDFNGDKNGEFIVSVDVADEKLLGSNMDCFKGKISLAIDHHPTNKMFAENTVLSPEASATCEIILELAKALKVKIKKDCADALYTGICTDTGCFRYSNVTPKTFKAAAMLSELGADTAFINKIMFETKTRGRLEIEKRAIESIKYFMNDKVAIMTITAQMMKEAGCDESDIDGVSAIPRQIEGVDVGVLIRERGDNVYKYSVRTSDNADASKICGVLGGGGHARAGGATNAGNYEETLSKIIDAIKECYGKS